MIQLDSAILSRRNFAAFVSEVFESRGAEAYLGEPVTLAEHMLQAATLAEEQGMGDEVVVAALLHDIGHLVSEFGTFSMKDAEDRYHEEAGARVLRGHFPLVVVDCVRHHVAAKRFLCATEPAYLRRLSPASLHSLHLQGGPMNDEELAVFERIPHKAKIVQIRRLDDAGKTAGRWTPELQHFAPRVQRLIDRHAAAAQQTGLFAGWGETLR